MSQTLASALFGDPFAIMNTIGLVAFALVGSAKAIREGFDLFGITVVSDAVGLAAFATTSAIVATGAGISAFGIVAIAAINAVGGGAVADILLDRSPFILFDDFYRVPRRKPTRSRVG